MMGRPIENRLGEIDIMEVEIIRSLAGGIAERHPHVILADRSRPIPLSLQHFRQRHQLTLDHRGVRAMWQPTLLLKIGAMCEPAGQ